MGNDVGLKQLILKEFHDSFAEGHSRIEATKKRIRDHFYWKGLKHVVKEFVKQCEVYQRNKLVYFNPYPFQMGLWRN